MKRQTGVSLSGLIVILFLVFFVALLGFKLFTPYSQYFTIQKTFKALAANPELKSGNQKEIASAFQRYAQIDGISAIEPADIEVSKEGNDITISASYAARVPLFANISLVIDFNATSAAK